MTSICRDEEQSKDKLQIEEPNRIHYYSSSLVVSGVIMPTVIAVITLGLYFSSPPLLAHWFPKWYSVFFGLLLGCIIWLLGSALLSFFAKAGLTTNHFHEQLEGRLKQIKAHLEELDRKKDPSNKLPVPSGVSSNQRPSEDPVAIAVARKQICTHETNARHCLKQACRSGLHWLPQATYLTLVAWREIHRAEEDLIMIEPSETIVQRALHDKSRLHDIPATNREKLSNQLDRGIRALNPTIEMFYEEIPPWRRYEEHLIELARCIEQNDKMAQLSQKQIAHIPNKIGKYVSIQKEEKNTNDNCYERNARLVLREVRRAINDFREERWESILRLRSQLIKALVAAEVVTYTLLCLVIFIIGNHSGPAADRNKEAFLAAIAFYTVGSIAGLFARFYGESERSDLSNDYGLSVTRLIATPLFSGLAGVGGVFITQVLTMLTRHPVRVLGLAEIFQFDPFSLFTAAAFGLTPNLVMQSLKRQVEATKPEATKLEEQQVT